MVTPPLPLRESCVVAWSRSRGIDLEYVRVIARRLFREVHRDSIRVSRPHEVRLRPQQSDLRDLAAVVGGVRSQRLNRQFSVSGPSQRYGIQRVPLGRKSHVTRGESWKRTVRGSARGLGRTFAGDLPGPGGVDRLAV